MSFDLVAPWYRTLERIAFGDALQRCRVACLDEIDPPAQVLIVGEGNGRFLSDLLRRYPETKVDCIDASERMLQLARNRVQSPNVRWLCEDVTKWKPPENHYDLVVTHFVLDCFQEPTVSVVVAKLAAACSAEARWMIADFRLPESGLARIYAGVWLAVMYQFFRYAARIEATELIDPTQFIQRDGFSLKRQHLFRGGMLKSQLWAKVTSENRDHRRVSNLL